MDRGAWRATVYGVTESDTMELLTNSLHFSVTRWQSLGQEQRLWLVPVPRACPGRGGGCLVWELGVCTMHRVTPAWSSGRMAWRLTAAALANCSRLCPCECVNSLPSFCRMTACVAIPLLEWWARLRSLWEWLDRWPLFLDSLEPSPRNVWNVRFPVGAAFACALPVKILQKAVNCN